MVVKGNFFFNLYSELSYQVTELAATCYVLRNSRSGTETHSNRRSAWGLSGSCSLSQAFMGMLFNTGQGVTVLNWEKVDLD